MDREQDRQGRILRNLRNFLMDNHANPIVIKESSQAMDSEEEEPLKDPQENQVEEYPLPNPDVHMDEDDGTICVGEVLFDANGNLVEQCGNFCLHYPNCSSINHQWLRVLVKRFLFFFLNYISIC